MESLLITASEQTSVALENFIMADPNESNVVLPDLFFLKLVNLLSIQIY